MFPSPYLRGQLLGGATDIDGRHRIENVPYGRHTIQAAYLGYQNAIMDNIIVGSGKKVILNIEMTENVQ